MKISIITVVWNNAKTIKDAINSVLNQSYKDVEYIVIDGASTDGTIEIVKSYGDRIKFISEKDNGLYDAMNKGIRMATGDVVGILNSDDFYASDKILQIVADEFLKGNIDSVYANLEYIDANDPKRVIRYWRSKKYQEGIFRSGWHPAHPTFFVKKEIYEQYGVFDLSFKIAADYELMLRFFEKYKITSSYVDEVFVKMRIGGESNKSIKNIIKANLESYMAWKANGLYINPLRFLLKPFSKIVQFINK